MADPFAIGLGALHRGPCSVAAVYTPAGGAAPVDPIRVIRSQPDERVSFGEGQIVQATELFVIQRSDVAAPAIGDRLNLLDAAGVLTGEVFQLFGEPMRDVEGLSFTCGAEPVL